MSEVPVEPGRRRPGPVRKLSRAQVADAALDVMAQQGLEAVSFRTVSMRLGVDGKALYTYVGSKDDLLAAMFDRVVAGLSFPSASLGTPTLDQLVDLLVSFRSTLVTNPDLYRLIRPLEQVEEIGPVLESFASALLAISPDPVAALRVWSRVLHYTLGSALYAARSMPRPTASPTDLLDAHRHPSIAKIADAKRHEDGEAEFARVARTMLQTRIGEPPA
jgi:TetR/AcrR family transcriptional regulator, tetracycline repressor protein